MRKLKSFICVLVFLGACVQAFATQCPANPDALGTSRVLAIGPNEFSHVGSMQYKQTLPLNDHEVVITFDDSPLPPYTDIILKILGVAVRNGELFPNWTDGADLPVFGTAHLQ